MTSIARPLIVPALALGLAAAGCSRTADQYVARGNKLFAAKDYKAAIVEYRSAIAKSPRLGEAHRELANAYAQVGDLPSAVKEYARAADLLPDDAALQVKTGEYLLLGGRWDDAKARAEAALAKEPTNAEAQLVRARALGGLKDVDGAIAEVEKLVAEGNETAPAYANLGILQLAKGHSKEAEAAFEKAVATAPRSIPARVALANFYWQINRLTDAEAVLKDALKIDARDVLVNRMLALVLLREGHADEAEVPLKLVADTSKDPNAKFILANYYTATGRTQDATALLTALTKDEATYVSATLRLASIASNGKDTARAERLVDEVLVKDPKNAQALLARSALLAGSGKIDAAVEAAKAAAVDDPQSADAQFALGRLYASKNDVDAALGGFNQALKLAPTTPAPKLELANLYLAKGDAATALSFARQAVSERRTVGAQLVLVRALLANNDLDTAQTELAPLVQAFPSMAAVQVQQGNLAWLRKNRREAKQAFDAALKSDPSNREALNGLVAIAVAEKDVAAAESIVNARVASAPKDGSLLLTLGNLKQIAGDFDGAAAAYQQAVVVSPSLLPAYQALGALYVKQNKLPQALQEFNNAAARAPDSVAMQTAAGVLSDLLNKPEEARKRYERVLELNPRAPVAANNLAWMYAQSGANLDIALQLAQIAKAQLPDRPEVNDTLGWIYCQKGLTGLAIQALTESTRSQPDNPTYLFHLGVAYAKAGDAPKARAALDKALATDPRFQGNTEARDLLARLKG
jgi:tetratricopeptide (TPR) repeat protein